jgi:hypothetical protein
LIHIVGDIPVIPLCTHILLAKSPLFACLPVALNITSKQWGFSQQNMGT